MHSWFWLQNILIVTMKSFDKLILEVRWCIKQSKLLEMLALFKTIESYWKCLLALGSVKTTTDFLFHADNMIRYIPCNNIKVITSLRLNHTWPLAEFYQTFEDNQNEQEFIYESEKNEKEKYTFWQWHNLLYYWKNNIGQ